MMALPYYGEEIMIVGRTMWTQCTSVTDRQTDRQTDGQTDRQNYDHKDRATQSVGFTDYSYLGLFVRWTVRTLLDCSYHGLFVPSLDFSYLGLFVPWTVRTFLDCSYHGLFVPSWTLRTMDYSYHHWTIRIMLAKAA